MRKNARMVGRSVGWESGRDYEMIRLEMLEVNIIPISALE